MSDTTANVLLLSDDTVAEEMTRLAGPSQFAHVGEPYEALEELSRRRYDAVVMAEGYPDLPGLARAVRRLNGSIRTYALCSPAGEADLRSALPEELDDYLIYPPSPEDLERIFRAAPLGVYQPVAGEGLEAELSVGQIAALIEACTSSQVMTERIARLVGQWTGLEVRWADAAKSDESGEPLLLLDVEGPKVLLGEPAVEIPPEVRKRLQALQAVAEPLAAQARRVAVLHRLAITDHLTGAYNRRYFYHFTDQLLLQARAEQSRATLLLYDIDDFKRYNDAYGHAAGDEILRETAALMKEITREHDVVARIGGDEFAVLFWDAEPPRRPDSRHPQAAQELTSRFVEALAEHKFSSLGPEAAGVLTISGGLATFPWDGHDCRELLRHADAALRRAKKSGKGVVYLVGHGDRTGREG